MTTGGGGGRGFVGFGSGRGFEQAHCHFLRGDDNECRADEDGLNDLLHTETKLVWYIY